MNQKTLKAFTTLSDLLHFRKASEKCCMTVSTLTRMIQNLEEEMGVLLFERSKRGVALTFAGKEFYKVAHHILESLDEFKASFSDAAPEAIKAEVKIYTTVTAAYHIFPKLTKQLRNYYPNIMTYLETGSMSRGFSLLQDERVDFMIGIINSKNVRLCESHKLLETALQFILPINEETHVFEMPMILPQFGDLCDVIMAYFQSKSLNMTVHSYVEGHEAILGMVASGLGAAILPEIVVKNSHLCNAVKIFPVNPPLPSLEVGIFMKKSDTLSRGKQFVWEFIKNQHKNV